MVIEKIGDGITEAQASAVYFLEDTNFNTMGHAVVVDIGGGTSDISRWYDRNIQWEDSVKFAGSDLVAVLDDLLHFIGIANPEPYAYDIAMRRWPQIHKNWNGKMENFQSRPESMNTLQTIGLFYAGISYYVGMHLKRENLVEPLRHLAFAGNGIRFLEIITFGDNLSEHTPALVDWIGLFREMLKAGHNISGNYDTLFTFSPNPKLEVVYGLVSNKLGDYAAGKDTTRKMFGLDVTWEGNQYQSHEWNPEVKATDFKESDIDFKGFVEFIKKYKTIAPAYFKNWQLNSLPEEFNRDMRTSLFSALEKRGNEELASPLFLEALKAYMKCQYKR
ncbi:MAG: hypothetical protein QME52_01750 [Bacteroidota bacterium]|nr:hypothetical protein [Bacteroidota bacterium]